MKNYFRKPETTHLSTQWDGSKNTRKIIEKAFFTIITADTNPGDWIVKVHNCAVASMSDEVFREKYQEVESPTKTKPYHGRPKKR